MGVQVIHLEIGVQQKSLTVHTFLDLDCGSGAMTFALFITYMRAILLQNLNVKELYT